jgi:hypothetical protein
MGPPTYMRSVVDRNVVMRLMAVFTVALNHRTTVLTFATDTQVMYSCPGTAAHRLLQSGHV